MSKKILKYTSISIVVLSLLILYLSTAGIETEKFNNQIKDLVKKKNDKLDITLKKIKLTLDPLNFKSTIKYPFFINRSKKNNSGLLFVDLINDTKFLSKIGLVDISICEVTN